MASGKVQFCTEVCTESTTGIAYLQKWWSDPAQTELVRFSRTSGSGDEPATGELIAEHEMIALIHAALTSGLFSGFARRQLLALLLSHYDDER